MEQNYFIEQINFASQIAIYKNGEETIFEKESDEFEKIKQSYEKMLTGYREMPAFSVSLDEETRKEKMHGLWIEIIFNDTFTHNEMPYTKLLIKVEKEFTGFNIIRYNNHYDGRCYYVDISNNMEELFLTIENVLK